MDPSAFGASPLFGAKQTLVRAMITRMRTLLMIHLLILATIPGTLAAQSPGPVKASPAGGMLRPGDIVRLRIWREPDLSGELAVDEEGTVVFPKLGPKHVAGLSPEALKTSLVAEYQRYLRNPSIEVTVLRRVTILGEVRKPGVYPVDATTTIADALALAGGVMPDGRENRLEVRRGGERIAVNVEAGVRIADSPIQSGDQLYVPERSWLSRNVVVMTTLFSVASSVVVALILR